MRRHKLAQDRIVHKKVLGDQIQLFQLSLPLLVEVEKQILLQVLFLLVVQVVGVIIKIHLEEVEIHLQYHLLKEIMEEQVVHPVRLTLQVEVVELVQ